MEFALFYSTNLETFWQITFSRCTFSNYFHGFEISSAIFGYSYEKKNKKNWGSLSSEYIYKYYLELAQCKFARNGSTN
jgi:hypothetical protein